MSYDGQNDAKRAVRYGFWTAAYAITGKPLYSCALYDPEPRVLVLAGPDAGDVELLRALGVSSTAITAVDTNEEYCDRLIDKDDHLDVRCGNVVDVLEESDKFNLILLDFCGHVSRSMARTVWRVVDRHGAPGCAIGVGFMRGREKVDYKAAAPHHLKPSNSFQVFRPATGTEPECPRMLTIERWLHEQCTAFLKPWCPISFAEWRYQGSGVPMSYCLWCKAPRNIKEKISVASSLHHTVQVQSKDVRNAALEIDSVFGFEAAWRGLQLSKSTVAAWKAVHCRRTGNKSGLGDIFTKNLSNQL